MLRVIDVGHPFHNKFFKTMDYPSERASQEEQNGTNPEPDFRYMPGYIIMLTTMYTKLIMITCTCGQCM